MTSTHQAVRNKPFLQTGVEATVSFRLRGLSRTAILFSFVLVLLIGAAVRFMSYDRFLPFQDRTDESVYQVTSLHRRGVEPNAYVEVYYASQPPAYIWLTMMIQPFVEYGRPWTLLADYLHMQKLLAVLIGILTTAIIMRLGWLLGGNTAAFFAGLVWAFSSEIVDRNNQALPDPFVYLTVAASLVMVIHALRHESSHWLFGSLLMGIAAIYFKYTPWYILIPWGIVALILLRRRPRQMLPWLALQVLVGILCAWYLLVNYAALDLPNREVDTFRGEGLMMALTPWRNFNNLWSSIRPIGGEAIFLVIMPLGVLAYLYNRGRGGWLVDKRWYGILVIYCVVGLLMISSFTNVWEALPKYRHTMPVTIALLGLWSAAITQIIQAVIKLRDSRPAVKIWRWMPAALGVLVTLWIVVPHTFSNA